MRLVPPAVVVDDDVRRVETVSLVLRGAYGDLSLETACDGVALARTLQHDPVGMLLIHSGLGWAPLEATAGLLRELHPDAALVVLADPADDGAVELALAVGADAVVAADARGLSRLPGAVHTAAFRARRRRLAGARDQPYRHLFRTLDLGAFLAAADGTILEANRALAELLGADGPERLVRRTIADLLSADNSRTAWRDALTGPAAMIELDAHMSTVGGAPDEIAVRLRAWSAPDAAGGEPRILGTVSRAAPSHPGPAAADGESGSSAEIEQLASAISHDLRQSLRVVDRSLDLMAGSAGSRLEPEEQEHLERARTAASDLDRLFDGILRWARLPTLGGDLETVELDGVLDRVLQRLEAQRRESGGTVAREPLPAVTADPGQMELLLQNLLENAFKFSGDEPPQVHVSAHRETGAWRIAVRDSGIGIDPAAAERVFGLFQRQRGATDTPGHGIGLAVCQRIVAGHGGRIWVDSQPGRGATFCFTLPDRVPTGSDGGSS